MRLPSRTLQDRLLSAALFGAAAAVAFEVILGSGAFDWFIMPLTAAVGIAVGFAGGPRLARATAAPGIRGWALGGLGGGAVLTVIVFVLTLVILFISSVPDNGDDQVLEGFVGILFFGGIFILPLALPLGAAAGLVMYAVGHARSPSAA
jgi:hypothetical protein